MDLPHQKPDIAGESFQFLEDLATGYWYSEVLFAALELNICGLLAAGPEPCSTEELAAKCGCDPDGLGRLVAALVSLGLIVEDEEGRLENGPLAARYLVPGSESYAGDFLNYRRYFAPHWGRLVSRVSGGVDANARPAIEPREAYEKRVFDYVRAMDVQARLKAADAMGLFERASAVSPRWILDVGGGAGAWCRAFLTAWPGARAVLVDLPETMTAARKIYPDPADWRGIEPVAGNALAPCFVGGRFDVVVLSNILHAYGRREAMQLLRDALHCLAPGGAVLIHDYLADHHTSSPLKGSLYDLHMMLNTYNGRVYRMDELTEMLDEAGLKSSRLIHLQTDTSIILAGREEVRTGHEFVTRREMLTVEARRMGFGLARVIETGHIAVEPWVRLKCRFGCSRHGASLTCPPHSPDEAKMREILSRYTHALLVQGTPPSKQFHERLLALERHFFLGGYHEALAFGAGPCPVCSECSPDGQCRFPEKARPALEACGVDVYETARRAGLSLNPVTHPYGYVKYVGLVLFRAR